MNKIVKYVIISAIIILLVIGTIGLFAKSNGDNKPSDNEIVKTKTIKHKHYEYEIPETWEYNQDELYFDLTNPSENGWTARVSLIYDADEYLLGRNSLINKDLEDEGYNYIDPETKTVNGTEYLIYKASIINKEGILEERLIGYFHSERQYTYSVNILSKKEGYDLDALYVIGSILLKGKFDNTDTKYSYYSYDYGE